MKEAYRVAKGEACRMYDHAITQEAKDWWAKRIAWLDKKLKAQPSNQPSKIKRLKRFRMMIWIINIAVILQIVCCTSCKATAGLGQDITWFGQAGEKMLKYESRNK